MNHTRSASSSQRKVHVIHEWLTEWGGSEDVTRLILQCLPGASLSATIDFLSPPNRIRLGVDKVGTTFLQRMPFVQSRFWHYLPITPLAIESLDFSDADLIVSSSHAFAKGVLTTAEQLHISYVHSPMRYAWDLHFEYLNDYGLDKGLKGYLARWMFHRLRLWDRQTAHNVDLFLANSRHVQRRIWRTYRRPARVLYPPVRTDRFAFTRYKHPHYVTVSRLVSYKRIDLLVKAFARMPDRRLVVIGDGPEMPHLQKGCPPNVELRGWQPDSVVQEEMGRAQAFLFAAQEDFGISPVEAQACGTPVIAYGVGGSRETVRDIRSGVSSPTGLLFPEQTVTSLMDAIEDFEGIRQQIAPENCRLWAETFSEARFEAEFTELVELAWEYWHADPSTVEKAVLSIPEPRTCSVDTHNINSN